MSDTKTRPKKVDKRLYREDKPLSPREYEVVNLYTDPNSPTFLNGTRTIKASKGYNAANDDVAAVSAHQLLKRPHVANEVRERLTAMGMGEDTRLRIASKIASGYVEEIVTQNLNAEGEVTSESITKRPINPKLQLEAIKHLNRIDGSDDIRKVEAHIMSDAMRRLSRSLMQQKTVTPVDDTIDYEDAVVSHHEALTADVVEYVESAPEDEQE